MHQKPVRLHEISAAVGQPPQTVLRYLNTLQDQRYVNKAADTMQYYLTMKLCQLGNQVNSQNSIRAIVRPYLAEIVQHSGESACLAVEEQNEVVYIDVEYDPDTILKVTTRIGKAAPLYCTGVGKLLLLNRSEPQLLSYIQNTDLHAFTPNTITTPQALLQEINHIRKNGYAIDKEECELGVCCLAVPILTHNNEILACISISGPISRLNQKKMSALTPFLLNISKKISLEMT